MTPGARPSAGSGRPECAEGRELLAEVRALGWQRGWFEYARREVSRGHAIDDARAADWTYLTGVGPEARVLVTGSPLLVTAAALAARVRDVWVVVAGDEEATLVDLWRRQTGRLNVHVVRGDVVADLPFGDAMFDLVSIGSDVSLPPARAGLAFADVACGVSRLLRPNGIAHFVVGNRFSPARLASRRTGPDRIRLQSAGGYRRVLQRLKFGDIRVLAPLPRHTRTPLCYLPLDNPSAVRSFLRDLFPLFAAVSPEAKKAYALEYWAARLGVSLMTRGNLGGLLKHVVPGYCILAQRMSGSPPAGHAS